MYKQEAVASLGQASLLQPARVKSALKANDRLKLYLTILQAAKTHAQAPDRAAADLSREIAVADIGSRDDAAWLRELPASASMQASELHLPELRRLLDRMHDDLYTMARPVLEAEDADALLAERASHWQLLLRGLAGQEISADTFASLTRGRREDGDSLHLTVMDLHKALNRLSSRLSGESISGAHVWQLSPDGSDAPLIEAFMRGVERTRALKLDHPGLDTAATRDGRRLLIQNDIGTNDVHVLVIQVEDLGIALTYSDLHRQRFAFFQSLLAGVGAQWSAVEARTTAGLNAGSAYHVGTATFNAADPKELGSMLEAIGSRIVFLIDWNRARKRLLSFVDKDGAVAVLHEAADREVGHMAWLHAGGERLVWDAMAAQGEGAFRLGDRLDNVMGAAPAAALLVDIMVLASQGAARRKPAALIADEARLLVARRLRGRPGEFELLEEHAGICHALAQALSEGLSRGVERDASVATKLAGRAKTWERQADHLVMRARARAERQPQWEPFARLIERSDDVADALEEAAFVLSLVAERHHHGWGASVLTAMQALADAVLVATQDHVKAIEVASTLGEASDAADQDEYLDASWRVLQAERQCDELLRAARRALAREVDDPASLMLSNELASALEKASDHLLAVGYGLRDHALRRVGKVSP